MMICNAGVMQLVTVAVLFAREDSHYKTLPQCDVYDMARDARTYDGPHPVVAHPPCRAWATLRHHALPRPDERNLARLAVALVREFGGVLEHPHRTTLWEAQRLPAVGQRDAFGGFTLVIDQNWWGHRAQKRTRLYVVAANPQKCHRCRWCWARRRTPLVYGVAATKPPAAQALRNTSMNTRRPSWRNGWLIWPSAASGITRQ